MKSRFILGLSFLFINIVSGNPVDTTLAKQVAKTFFEASNSQNIRKNLSDYQLVYQSGHQQKSNEAQVYFYVFNVSTCGFIIVSADDCVMPVLGYSNQSNFDPNNIPPALHEILDQYTLGIEYAIKNKISANQDIAIKWNNLKNAKTDYQKASKQSVSPLIQTTWSQNGNQCVLYNNLCPYDSSANKHCYTGCVATAMAQILKYWEYPTCGLDSHSYIHPKYGVLSADFKNTTYRYDLMPNALTCSSSEEEVNAVALLMYHCGVSIDMDYSVNGSGASTFSVKNSLRKYFSYLNIQHLDKYYYNDSDWVVILKKELNAKRPILYRGSGAGSHAFICDGYDENDYFHFNWGWGGDYDGYFAVTALNPAGTNFSNEQEILINIKGYPVSLKPDNNNILYVTPEGSGTKDGSSWDNATPDLEHAVAYIAQNPVKIWVKKGIYYGDTSLYTAFTVAGGNQVYGGFKGNESANYDLSLRDFMKNKTILDGQHKQRVVYLNPTIYDTSITLCDGFTICNGYTNNREGDGGGIYADYHTLIKNCIIENNAVMFEDCLGGGGVFIKSGSIINCFIRNNESTSMGGGVLVAYNRSYLINCIIANNHSYQGGGINSGRYGTFINTTIVQNTALGMAGGIRAGEQDSLINCIIWGNQSDDEGSQIYSPTTITTKYCAIQGGYPGHENIDLEAENDGEDDTKNYVRFLSPDSSHYKLKEGSVCIDAGDPDTSCLGSVAIDLNYGNRIVNHRIDIGAYEYGSVSSISNREHTLNAKLYPNPANSYIDLHIFDDSYSFYNLRLFDITGKVLIKQPIENQITRLSLINLSKGIYFLQLRNANEYVKTFKVVKQ